MTRRSGDIPKDGGERLADSEQGLLKPGNFRRLEIGSGEEALVVDLRPREEGKPQRDLRLLAYTPPRDGCTTLQHLFDEAYQTDSFPTEVLNYLRVGTQHYKKNTLGDCGEDNGHLTYRDNQYVPEHEPLRLHLMQKHHDSPAMGHPGRAKTLKLLQRRYY